MTTATRTTPARVTLEIPFALDCVQPGPALATEIYNAVECLRIAAVRLTEMHDNFEDDEDRISPWYLGAACSACELYARLLQETFGGVLPSISDRVFKTLATYANRWPANQHGAEGTVLALRFVCRSLDRALELSEEANGPAMDDLDGLLVSATDMSDMYANLMDSCCTAFDDKEVMQLIDDGAELPRFHTQAEVDATKARWEADDAMRRQRWRNLEALESAAEAVA